MRRAPLLALATLGTALGGCTSNRPAATCPPGSLDDGAGVCRVQCQVKDSCLLTEACLEGLCQPDPTELPTIELFRATRTAVTRGQSSTVEFVVVGAERVELLRSDADGQDVSVGIDASDLSARVEVRRIISDTRVRLEAYRGERSVADEILIRMDGTNPNQVEIVSFEATPNVVAAGERVTLAWTTQNATGVELTRNGAPVAVPLDVNGRYEDVVSETTVFALTAVGAAGSDEAQVTVDVRTSSEGPEVLDLSFVPSGKVIDEGDNAVVKWRTADANRIALASDGNVLLNTQTPALVADGAWLVHPAPGDTAYRLAAQAPGETPASRTEILSVLARPAPPQLSGVSADPLIFLFEQGQFGLQVRWQVTPGDATVQVRVGQQVAEYVGSGSHSARVTGNQAIPIEVRAVVPEGGIDVVPLLAVPQIAEAGGSGPNRPENLEGVARFGALELAANLEADWYQVPVPEDGVLLASLYGDCPPGLRLQLYAEGAVSPVASAQSQSRGDCPIIERRDLDQGVYRLRVSFMGMVMVGQLPYGIYAMPLGPQCGDGRVQGEETCDDGNRAFGDACLPTCTVDPAYLYSVEETPPGGVMPPPNAEVLTFAGVSGTEPGELGAAVAQLPFEFRYFGRTMRGAMVFTDGYLSFLPGRVGEAVDPRAPIGPVAPNALVAAALADLSLAGGGRVVTWSDADPQTRVQRFVIAWQDAGIAEADVKVRFRIELYEDGRVAIAYGDAFANADVVFAAGLEGPTGQVGFGVPACRTDCMGESVAGRRFVFSPSGVAGAD